MKSLPVPRPLFTWLQPVLACAVALLTFSPFRGGAGEPVEDPGFTVTFEQAGDGTTRLRWPTQEALLYQPQVSADKVTWTEAGPALWGDGEEATLNAGTIFLPPAPHTGPLPRPFRSAMFFATPVVNEAGQRQGWLLSWQSMEGVPFQFFDTQRDWDLAQRHWMLVEWPSPPVTNLAGTSLRLMQSVTQMSRRKMQPHYTGLTEAALPQSAQDDLTRLFSHWSVFLTPPPPADPSLTEAVTTLPGGVERRQFFRVVRTVADSDGDGFTDWQERFQLDTDAFSGDSDGDGWSDWLEYYNESDPLDSSVVPSFSPPGSGGGGGGSTGLDSDGDGTPDAEDEAPDAQPEGWQPPRFMVEELGDTFELNETTRSSVHLAMMDEHGNVLVDFWQSATDAKGPVITCRSTGGIPNLAAPDHRITNIVGTTRRGWYLHQVPQKLVPASGYSSFTGFGTDSYEPIAFVRDYNTKWYHLNRIPGSKGQQFTPLPSGTARAWIESDFDWQGDEVLNVFNFGDLVASPAGPESEHQPQSSDVVRLTPLGEVFAKFAAVADAEVVDATATSDNKRVHSNQYQVRMKPGAPPQRLPEGSWLAQAERFLEDGRGVVSQEASDALTTGGATPVPLPAGMRVANSPYQPHFSNSKGAFLVSGTGEGGGGTQYGIRNPDDTTDWMTGLADAAPFAINDQRWCVSQDGKLYVKVAQPDDSDSDPQPPAWQEWNLQDLLFQAEPDPEDPEPQTPEYTISEIYCMSLTEPVLLARVQKLLEDGGTREMVVKLNGKIDMLWVDANMNGKIDHVADRAPVKLPGYPAPVKLKDSEMSVILDINNDNSDAGTGTATSGMTDMLNSLMDGPEDLSDMTACMNGVNGRTTPGHHFGYLEVWLPAGMLPEIQAATGSNASAKYRMELSYDDETADNVVRVFSPGETPAQTEMILDPEDVEEKAWIKREYFNATAVETGAHPAQYVHIARLRMEGVRPGTARLVVKLITLSAAERVAAQDAVQVHVNVDQLPASGGERRGVALSGVAPHYAGANNLRDDGESFENGFIAFRGRLKARIPSGSEKSFNNGKAWPHLTWKHGLLRLQEQRRSGEYQTAEEGKGDDDEVKNDNATDEGDNDAHPKWATASFWIGINTAEYGSSGAPNKPIDVGGTTYDRPRQWVQFGLLLRQPATGSDADWANRTPSNRRSVVAYLETGRMDQNTKTGIPAGQSINRVKTRAAEGDNNHATAALGGWDQLGIDLEFIVFKRPSGTEDASSPRRVRPWIAVVRDMRGGGSPRFFVLKARMPTGPGAMVGNEFSALKELFDRRDMTEIEVKQELSNSVSFFFGTEDSPAEVSDLKVARTRSGDGTTRPAPDDNSAAALWTWLNGPGGGYVWENADVPDNPGITRQTGLAPGPGDKETNESAIGPWRFLHSGLKWYDKRSWGFHYKLNKP